jgi:hypothetical protein
MKPALLAAALLLTACGTETSPRGDASAADPTDGPSTRATAMPTHVSPPTGQVTASGLVLDDGGPELCLGGVAESYPPQCGGIPIAGWDWADRSPADFEEANDVQWGEFVVWGTYDGETFTLERAMSSATVDPARPDDADPFETRCDEPDGGWPTAAASSPDQDEAFAAARGLEGYAGAFIDTSLDPRTPEQMDQDAVDGEYGGPWIVNVAVTGDVDAAEAALREVYDGPLCVFHADHTEAELQAIQTALQELPGVTSSSSGIDQVDASVLWDDGSLQEWADATYGAGLVTISSTLRPA